LICEAEVGTRFEKGKLEGGVDGREGTGEAIFRRINRVKGFFLTIEIYCKERSAAFHTMASFSRCGIPNERKCMTLPCRGVFVLSVVGDIQ